MANGLFFRPVAFSAVTSSSTALGYKASNVGEDRIGPSWKSGTGSASQWLKIDLGSDVTFDTITLHGMNAADDTWQLTVEIETEAQGGNFTGSQWTGSAQDLIAGATLPVSGKSKGYWSAPAGAPSAGRYIKLTFSALSNAAVQVSRVCVGAAIQLTRNYRLGAAQAVRPLGKLDFSARGVMLRRQGVKLRGLGIGYDAATQAEIETDVLPLFETVGNDAPIVAITDPDADAQLQNRIYYGFLTGDLGAINAKVGNLFTTQINVVAID